MWELCPERLKVADGPRYIPDNMTAEVSDGRLYVTCPNPGVEENDDLCKSGGAMHVYAWFWAPNYHAATDDHDRVFIDYASPSRYLGTFG